ncbi:MAG: hypothetical protein IPL61_01680 [Myxococcales bacterium]|nr:hypothetical protein [Myxococcales bacterium]
MRNGIWVGLAILATVACTKNVPQDLKTGEDGRTKGARELKIENNEARARGIVTYPGGDRVDWKMITLPKDQVGTVEFKLRWVPPRPGLDLSFEVYNEYYRMLDSAKPNTRKRSRKTTKSLSISNAKGKLYVQIYASDRGDAGTYTLTAAWTPNPIDDDISWPDVPISDPPKLPAVPEPIKACDLLAFDKANPDCTNKCPVAYDETWPGCAGVCPNPPKPEIKACKLCNKDALDPCLADCRQYYPECDLAKPDYTNPKCAGVERQPRDGEITDLKTLADGTQITINLGLVDGLDKTWTGAVLDPNGNPVANGAFKLTTIGKNASVARVKATDLPGGAPVRLTPPPGARPPTCK